MKRTSKSLTAKTADKFKLYELSVQNPEFEVGFLSRTFKKMTGRRPLHLREDFCGSALLCAKWVQSDKERTATGIDLDRQVLAWGEKNNLEPLNGARDRVKILRANVLDATGGKYDVAVAYNYSYFVFREREQLRRYFEGVRAELAPDGAFVCDVFGGPESQTELEESRKLDGFTYVWDQAHFNPIDYAARYHIHFHFRDGTKLEKAFTYDWRIWTLVEVKEILREAGFKNVDAYWEGEDEKGEGNGVFRKVTRAPADLCYNTYLVAYGHEKKKR